LSPLRGSGSFPRTGYRQGPARADDNRQIFVAYPWNLYTNRSTYKKAYTKLEKALSVKFVFAEDKLADVHVLDKVEEMIDASAFGIYDVSKWNPNVTLEYGLAKSRSILTRRTSKTCPKMFVVATVCNTPTLKNSRRRSRLS